MRSRMETAEYIALALASVIRCRPRSVDEGDVVMRSRRREIGGATKRTKSVKRSRGSDRSAIVVVDA
jgi:hypothetical protein